MLILTRLESNPHAAQADTHGFRDTHAGCISCEAYFTSQLRWLVPVHAAVGVHCTTTDRNSALENALGPGQRKCLANRRVRKPVWETMAMH